MANISTINSQTSVTHSSAAMTPKRENPVDGKTNSVGLNIFSRIKNTGKNFIQNETVKDIGRCLGTCFLGLLIFAGGLAAIAGILAIGFAIGPVVGVIAGLAALALGVGSVCYAKSRS